MFARAPLRHSVFTACALLFACSDPRPAAIAPAQVPLTPPSCASLSDTCGANQTESCCLSLQVPGGSFLRGGDANFPAKVGDFSLDKFEVSVGRFRNFWRSYDAWRGASHPMPSEGAEGRILGSGWDPGWDADLDPTANDLAKSLRCLATEQTWTESENANHTLPINCVNWYQALAFCVWDGGRLPTEAEWEYAAAGGSEQRAYPWGELAPGKNAELSAYRRYFNPDPTAPEMSDIPAVGSIPAGNGKLGQADLAGSMWEWVFDWKMPYQVPCVDCFTNTNEMGTTSGNKTYRSVRGGSWNGEATFLKTSFRNGFSPDYHYSDFGVRCARPF